MRRIKAYVSVPTLFFDQSRLFPSELDDELESLKEKFLKEGRGRLSFIYFNPNKHEWGEQWENTVDNADLILHYMKPSYSDYLGKGGFKVLMKHPNTPQYIVYKTLHSKEVKIYSFTPDNKVDNNDWRNYCRIAFGDSVPFFKVADVVFDNMEANENRPQDTRNKPTKARNPVEVNRARSQKDRDCILISTLYT